MQQLNGTDAVQIVVDVGDHADASHNHEWKPSYQGHHAHNKRRDGEAVVSLTVAFLVKISGHHFHSAQQD